MARYGGTKKRQKINGNQKINHYETTIYSSIPESDGDIYIITQNGDRLDLLAHTYYNDSSLWWYIAKANDLTSMNVPAGKSLVIPASAEGAIGG